MNITKWALALQCPDPYRSLYYETTQGVDLVFADNTRDWWQVTITLDIICHSYCGTCVPKPLTDLLKEYCQPLLHTRPLIYIYADDLVYRGNSKIESWRLRDLTHSKLPRVRSNKQITFLTPPNPVLGIPSRNHHKVPIRNKCHTENLRYEPTFTADSYGANT